MIYEVSKVGQWKQQKMIRKYLWANEMMIRNLQKWAIKQQSNPPVACSLQKVSQWSQPLMAITKENMNLNYILLNRIKIKKTNKRVLLSQIPYYYHERIILIKSCMVKLVILQGYIFFHLCYNF